MPKLSFEGLSADLGALLIAFDNSISQRMEGAAIELPNFLLFLQVDRREEIGGGDEEKLFALFVTAEKRAISHR